MGNLGQKVDYIWKSVIYSFDLLASTAAKQSAIDIDRIDQSCKAKLQVMERNLSQMKRELEEVEGKFERRIKRLEAEKLALSERNDFLEARYFEMEEKQNKAISAARSRGIEEFEYKTKQLSRYLDKMEQINEHQDKLINKDLATAITVATRKNYYFKDACCETDLTIGINQYVQSFFGLQNSNTGQNIMINQMLSHPLESFFVKDIIYKKQMAKEDFDEIFEKFIFERSSISNHDPCYSLLEHLAVLPAAEHGAAMLPTLSRRLTKMCLYFSKQCRDGKTSELFSSIFGIQRQQRMSGVEWANLCFLQKILGTYFRKVSSRSLTNVGFRTRVAKAELADMSRMMTRIKRDLDIEAILADLTWLQVKSTIDGDFLESVKKEDIPKDHLILVLAEKLNMSSYSEAIKRIVFELESRDKKDYGFIMKSDLDTITSDILKIPEDAFKRYHEIWFKPHLQHDLFFDYHSFISEFIKAFLQGTFDPTDRNPEVYVIDILLMKAKYLRKVSWIERERVKDYLSDQLTAVDLDSIAFLVYTQSYKQLDEKQKSEVFKAVSAIRGTFEGKVNKETGYSFSVMSQQERNNLLNCLSDYVITSGVGNLADRILERPNQHSHFK